MNRRDILTATLAAPVVAVANVGPVMAVEAKTPIALTYREIIRRRDAIDAASSTLTDAEASEAVSAMMDLADNIVDMPTTGLMDFIYKLLGHTVNGDYGTSECPREDDLFAEARALVGKA